MKKQIHRQSKVISAGLAILLVVALIVSLQARGFLEVGIAYSDEIDIPEEELVVQKDEKATEDQETKEVFVEEIVPEVYEEDNKNITEVANQAIELGVPRSIDGPSEGGGSSTKEETRLFAPASLDIDLPVNIIWEDTNEKYRPQSVIVKLYENGVATNESIQLNTENNWSENFLNLPAEDEEGNPIEYSVKESNIVHYRATYTDFVEAPLGTGITITNTFSAPTSVLVEIKWDVVSLAEIDGLTVDTFLTNNGIVDRTKSITLSEETGWKGTFVDVPTADSDGNMYQYGTIIEELDNFTLTYGQMNQNGLITIAAVQNSYTLIILKEWKDKGYEQKRPESIAYEFWVNEHFDHADRIHEDDEWMAVYEDLPYKDEYGNTIKYDIFEVEKEGYKVEYLNAYYDGVYWLYIENTYEEPKVTPASAKQTKAAPKKLAKTADESMLFSVGAIVAISGTVLTIARRRQVK